MRPRLHNLAIETSTRQGSITLGRGGEQLATVPLPAQRRHDVGLVPGIDRLCRAHDVTPAELGEIYVALGPGSFTGLRVAVAAVKMLALAQDVKVVAVPSLDVLAANAPADREHVAVCLNLKRQTVYCAVYHRGEAVVAPRLRTIAELLAEAPRPLALLGDPLPELPAAADDVEVLAPTLAAPRSDAVWQIGRAMAQRGAFADPLTLVPLYIRRPEAVDLWEKRHPAQSNQKSEIRN